MKCYCVTFDITNRSSKTVYVSKNSTFQIGLKILNASGTPFASVKLLDSTGAALAKQASKLAQYTLYALTSGDFEDAKQYTPQVTVYNDLGPRKINLPPLTIVTTSSDVAELPGSANADLTDYYTKEQVDTKVSEAVAPLAPTSSLTAYWKKDETEEHQLTGTYEDGSEFSFTAICKKA